MNGTTATSTESDTSIMFRGSPLRAGRRLLERKLLNLILAVQGLGAFALITLGVVFTRFNASPRVMRPLLLSQIARSGVLLLPLAGFLAVALGFVIIGQTLSVLTRVGAEEYLGTVMVTVVVRELGPLLTALLVLSRTGTATVVELGTARALGEVEALEALGIDPVHYFVFPRVTGMAVGTFALTVYLIIGAVLSGYLWAFLEGVPLTASEYFLQLAGAMTGFDFVLLGLKTMAFGTIIAVTTCYHGLAQPMGLGDVSRATVRAVGQSIVMCGTLDALFMTIYFLS